MFEADHRGSFAPSPTKKDLDTVETFGRHTVKQSGDFNRDAELIASVQAILKDIRSEALTIKTLQTYK